jgi:RES domain-containing protein
MTSRQRHFEAIFRTLGSSDRGSFYRSIPLRFQATPLSAIGSIDTGGRYNPLGAFEVLYIGENPDTVTREVRMMVPDSSGRIVSVQKAPRIQMTINWGFQRIADLTDSAIRKRLRVTLKDLLAEWTDLVDAGIIPVTHVLGTAARDASIEALIVPSARHKGHKNMAVIYDCLLKGSFVEIHDPSGFAAGTTTRIDGKL